jgi:hypothetical protein
MKHKNYTCAICGKEKQTHNEWPTYRLAASGTSYEPVCQTCLKANSKETKKVVKEIKSAAKIVLPGGKFGI